MNTRITCAASTSSGWLLSITLGLPLFMSPGTATALDLQDKIDPLAEVLVDNGEVVGLVIGIVRDGQTQVLGYGETVKGAGKRPDGRTVYEIGSITKTFTAALLADMARRGEVKLDAPVQSLLPDDEVTMPTRDDQAITLAQLATHHSGLPRMPSNFKPAEPSNPYADYTADLMYAFLSDHKLRRKPGANYEYSNLGSGLLGHALALRTGKPYEAILTERVLKPLKMKNTSVTLTDAMRQRLAPPYVVGGQPNRNWDLAALSGAGGLRSTVDDMLLYVQANLATDDTPVHAALRDTHAARHRMPNGISIGLGWHIAREGATRVHSGMTGGYHSFVGFVPGRGIGVVVLSNTASPKVSALGEQVIRVAFGIAEKPMKFRKSVKVAPAKLKKCVGTYLLAPTFALTVTLEDGRLHVQATGQAKHPIFPESETKFFYKVVDAQITFDVDNDGKVKKLTLHQNGRDLPGQKVR